MEIKNPIPISIGALLLNMRIYMIRVPQTHQCIHPMISFFFFFF